MVKNVASCGYVWLIEERIVILHPAVAVNRYQTNTSY